MRVRGSTMATQVSRSHTLVDQSEVYLKRVALGAIGIIELILGFRLILDLAGSSGETLPTYFMYVLSQPFVAIFNWLPVADIKKLTAGGAYIEPVALAAMLIYGLVGFGLVKLFNYLARD